MVKVKNNLRQQFDVVNAKYKKLIEIATSISEHTPEEEKREKSIQAAYLWNEIKHDEIFLEMVYTNVKSPKVRQLLKHLDEIYAINEELNKRELVS